MHKPDLTAVIIAIIASLTIFPLPGILASTEVACDCVSMNASRPVLKMHSATLDHVRVGNQVLITSTIESYLQEDSTFAAIVEIRDSTGFTRSLNWQTGLLSQNEKTEIGISWIPDMANTYEIRVFVLSSITYPTAYSPIITSHVTIEN